MITPNIAQMKKNREKSRTALKVAVAQLVKQSGGKLKPYEALHAIIDKVVLDFAEMATYNDEYKPFIGFGLAETYAPATLEAANQAGLDPALAGPPEPAKTGLSAMFAQAYGFKGSKPSVHFYDDPSEAKPTSTLHDSEVYDSPQLKVYTWDGVPAIPTPNTSVHGNMPTHGGKVPAKITQNQQHWNPNSLYYWFEIGGTVAEKTVQLYGYTLPDGYSWEELANIPGHLTPVPVWKGGNGKVDLDQHLADYTAGNPEPAHKFGTWNYLLGGPLGHKKMNPGDYYYISGSAAATIAGTPTKMIFKLHEMNPYAPMTVWKDFSKDQIVIYYPEEQHVQEQNAKSWDSVYKKYASVYGNGSVVMKPYPKGVSATDEPTPGPYPDNKKGYVIKQVNSVDGGLSWDDF